MILAGPGSGKTRVITHRVANLLRHGVPARQILALTFTNKAADEMRSRVEQLAPGQPVWMSTFHRFCARLLRQYAALVGLAENFTIYDTSDSRQVLKRTLEELRHRRDAVRPERIAVGHQLGQEQPDHGRPVSNPGPAIRWGASWPGSIPPIRPDCWPRAPSISTTCCCTWPRCCETIPRLRATLDERLPLYPGRRISGHQPRAVRHRAGPVDRHPNLAVTGDPDQSIYGWRGANLSNILDFEKDYPEVRVVKLEQNYRSTKSILRVADHLIGHNVRRKQKRLFTENAEGPAVRLIALRHAARRSRGDCRADRRPTVRAGRRRPRDFAIFYRVNALSRTLEHRAARLRAFRIKWSTASSSISARRSRTCWPICSCSTIRATTWPFCE